MTTTPPPDHVPIARLGRAFRLRGEMRVHLTSPDHASVLAEAVRSRIPLHLGGFGAIHARSFEQVGGHPMIALEGIHDPETARKHVNEVLYAPKRALPSADDTIGSGWLVDAPVTLNGRPFGRVIRVDPGPQIVLCVAADDGDHLLPWGAPYVRSRGGTIDIVDPPLGLLGEA